MPLVRDIRDIAVHHASCRAPALEYQAVAPAARSAVAPPAFLLGPANAALLWDIFGQLETPAVGCYAIADALVAPTGVAIKDGVAFHADAFIHPRHHVVAISDRVNAAGLPERHVPGPLAVIYGPAHETWGHWLVDFMPRLWVLRAAGHDLAALRFLLPPDIRPFVHPLLAAAGLRPDQLETYAYWRELIRTDLLLLPTGLRAGDRLAPCFAAATAWWTQLLRAPTGIGARLFVSRTGAPQARQLANRAPIEAMARDAGFKLIRPEALTLQEQAAAFGGAEVIAGEYGSALHNSVFARADTLVVGLRGTSRHPSFVQCGIATALRQQHAYVFGDSGGQDVEQRYGVEPRVFAKAIEIIGRKPGGVKPPPPDPPALLKVQDYPGP
jgi:capsular polysaccharide biosynthesis protein